MSRLGNRRRVLTLAIALVAAVSVVGGALYARGASADVGPFNAHPVSVNPLYQPEDVSSAQQGNGLVFNCMIRAVRRCYSPQQIRKAYDIQPVLDQGIDGTGHTIVIIDAFQSPFIAGDLALFDSSFNLPAPPAFNIIPGQGSLTPFNPADPNMQGWSAEISLDVEWSHAVAPGATIDLVLSKTNNDSDILAATQYAVDNNLGDVISQSFGEAESCADPNLLKAEHAVFQEANAKGITLIASAGDQGAAQPTCDGNSFFLSASTPASDPLVLSVGGTHLIATPVVLSPFDPGGAYQSESVWNDSAIGGDAGGGGFSTVYTFPPYQAPFGVTSSRGVPDVAYNAAVDGGVIGFWGVLCGGSSLSCAFRFGGTSAGSPQWAGITVLANQMAGYRLGFLNNALYHIGKNPEYNTEFHDITVGNNSFGSITGFNAVTGWDAASGLGSPDVAQLLPDLIATHVGSDGSNL